MKKIILLAFIALPLAVRSQSDLSERTKFLDALSLVRQWRQTDTTLRYEPIHTYSNAIVASMVLNADSVTISVDFGKNVPDDQLKIMMKTPLFSTERYDSIEVLPHGFWGVSTTFIPRQSLPVVAGVCVRSLVYSYFKEHTQQATYSINYVEARAYALEKRFYDWFYQGNVPVTDQKNYYLCSKRADEYHTLSLLTAK